MEGNGTVFDRITRKGGMHVVYVTGAHGSVRFRNLKSHLTVSEPTIATRLDELEEASLLERTFYDEMPPRVEYSLTSAADELYDHLASLFEWAAEHDETRPSDPPGGTPPDGLEGTCVCCGIADEFGPTGEGDDPQWYHTVEGLMNTIKRTHAIPILVFLGEDEPIRYSGLKERLGAETDTALSSRLDELEDAELVERRSYDEIPPRVEYSLTERGRELQEHLRPLFEWGNRGEP